MDLQKILAFANGTAILAKVQIFRVKTLSVMVSSITGGVSSATSQEPLPSCLGIEMRPYRQKFFRIIKEQGKTLVKISKEMKRFLVSEKKIVKI